MKNVQTKSWLREMDQFGERVIFTFNGKSTMKSGTGFASTVLLVLITCVMFLFMGQSFIFKIDPSSTTSIVNLDSIPFFNTTNDNKMFIAIRMRISSTIKLDGKYFDSYVFRDYRVLPKKELYMIECSKMIGIDKNYFRKYELGDFYCIPINFEKFGGRPTDEESNYLSLTINPCWNRTTTCNPYIANLMALGFSPIFIDLYYPELFYDPNNYDNPINVKHSLVTDKYLLNSTINREIYLKTTKMNDDKGWIFKDIESKNYTSIGKSVVTKSVKAYSHDPIYYLDIHPSVGFEEYTRMYQKIQDVIAVVGGFIKIVQIAIGSLIFYYVKYLKSEYLINGLVNWQNLSVDQSSKSKVNNLMDEIKVFESKQTAKHKFNTHLGMSEKIDVHSLKIKDDKESSHIKGIEQSVELKNENSEFFLGKFVLKPKLEMKKIEMKPIKQKTSANKINFSNSLGMSIRYQLTLGEIIKKTICLRLLNKKQKTRVAAFELADNYVRELLDVFGYLNLVLEVKNLKNILFNSPQKACFNFIEKPTFCISENMDEKTLNAFRNLIYNSSSDEELEKNKIAEYYAYNIYSENITHIDKKLLAGLNEDVLKVISNRLTELRDSMKQNSMFKFKEELLDY